MTQMPLPGGEFGRYHIDSQIGIGGMGVVFRATDRQLKRPVALKVVSAQYAASEEYLQRFQREAEVMARVDSPHIVQIFDYGTQDGCPYLASQYVGGGDLSQHIRAGGPMAPVDAAAVCGQVAGALAAAHRAGVVHRDVKPSNVLLREGDDLHAYLCDFGIAQPSDAAAFTQTGGVTGSWGFLAPERVNGEPATPASDIYAVGCVLWACLTGQQPFSGSDIQVAMAHLNAEIPQLTGDDAVTAKLNEVLLRSMAKDPAARYASAEDLRRDLLEAGRLPGSGAVLPPQAERTVVRRAAPAAAAPAPSGPSRGLLLAVGALALVLAAGGIVWAVHAGGGHDSAGAAHHGSATPARKGPGVPGDANGDKKADLTYTISGESVTQRVSALSQAGGYGSPIVHKWAGGFHIYSGDVNGDGLADLVSIDTGSDGITIRVVDKVTGQDSTQVLHTGQIGVGAYVEPGDFNGDGWPDFVFMQNTKSGDGLDFFVSLGSKAGWQLPTRWFHHKDWNSLTYFSQAGAFSGNDNNDDLAVFFDGQNLRHSDPHNITDATDVLVSNGKKFELAKPDARVFKIPLGRTKDFVSWRVVGDINGDGKPEQVFIQQYAAARRVQVMTWDDAQGFSPLSAPWYDGPSARQQQGGQLSADTFDMADINGDGKDDLVILHEVAKGTYEVLYQESSGTKLLRPRQLQTYTSGLPRAWNGQLAEVF